MGVKVSAAQAALLVHRHERVVRGWIEMGKLVATKAGARMYEIDVDDLARVLVRGVVVDQALLDAMRAERASQLQPFQERMEQTLADLQRRMRVLELQRGAVGELIAAGVSTRPAPVMPAPVPIADTLSDYVPTPPARANGNMPTHLMSLAAFCKEHNINPNTVKDAVQRGELTCHRGHWRQGSAHIDYALDADEQAAVLERYG